MRFRRAAWVAVALLAWGPAFAAEGIRVAGPAGQGTETAEALAALPSIKVEVSFGTEHGPLKAEFEGPLLWTLLDQVHAIDPSKPRDSVRETVTVTGADGYTAVLALGEISPEFAAKPVIVAERMDGKPLGPGHFRLIVPGEKRGGRSVRDLVRITVSHPDGS